MALRSSGVSKSSIISKFNSSNSNALAYKQAAEDYAYSNGQILPADYLDILNKRAKTAARGTTASLAVKKKIDSVKNDVSIGAIEDQIRRGDKDPMDIIPLLDEKIRNEGIQEGTPAYNDILNKAVQANDDSIKRRISMAKDKWTQDSERDRGMADETYLSTVQELIGGIQNNFSRSSLVNDLGSFVQDAQKRQVDDQIAAIRRNFRETGADQTAAGKRAYAETLYGYSQQLREAGLNEKADQVYDQYLSANESYTNSLKGEGGKSLRSEVSTLTNELQSTPPRNKEEYKEKYEQLLQAKKELAQYYYRSGDDRADTVADDLMGMGYNPDTDKFDPAIIDERRRNGVSVSDNAIRRTAVENMYTGEGGQAPERGMTVPVMEDGVLKFKTITGAPQVGTTPDGRDLYDVQFEGLRVTDKDKNNTEFERDGYVQDEDGVWYKIMKETKPNGQKIFYINNKYSDKKTDKNIGFSADGTAALLPEQQFGAKDGKVYYREQAENGGWNFKEYDSTTGLLNDVDYKKVDSATGMGVTKVLEGSQNPEDNAIITKAIPGSSGGGGGWGMEPVEKKKLNSLVDVARVAEKTPEQIEAEKLQIQKAEALKPVVAKVNEQISQAQVNPMAQGAAPAQKSVATAITPQKINATQTGIYKTAANPVAAASVGGLNQFGNANEVSYDGNVIKRRSGDGGWNFFVKDLKGQELAIDITKASQYSKKSEQELASGSNNPSDKTKYGL
jgi:hypothetical protein